VITSRENGRRGTANRWSSMPIALCRVRAVEMVISRRNSARNSASVSLVGTQSLDSNAHLPPFDEGHLVTLITLTKNARPRGSCDIADCAGLTVASSSSEAKRDGGELRRAYFGRRGVDLGSPPKNANCEFRVSWHVNLKRSILSNSHSEIRHSNVHPSTVHPSLA